MSGEACWGKGRGVGKCVGVWGEVRGDVGGGVEKCVKVWGLNTLPPTFLTSPLTPQHTSLHLPSPFQSVAKLPCDKVSGKPYSYFRACCKNRHQFCFLSPRKLSCLT